jgi:hypothetical protein
MDIAAAGVVSLKAGHKAFFASRSIYPWSKYLLSGSFATPIRNTRIKSFSRYSIIGQDEISELFLTLTKNSLLKPLLMMRIFFSILTLPQIIGHY